MSAAIFSGNPAGATHYAINSSGSLSWYKISGKCWNFWFDGGWHSLASPAPKQEVIQIPQADQVAADERLHLIKNACTDISKAIEHYNLSLDCSAAIRATVEAMIDAGYRKS